MINRRDFLKILDLFALSPKKNLVTQEIVDKVDSLLLKDFRASRFF